MCSCNLAHVVQAQVDKGASYRGTSWVERHMLGKHKLEKGACWEGACLGDTIT